MEALADFLFPPRCPGCGQTPGLDWCRACEETLSPSRQPVTDDLQAWVCGPYTGLLQRAILRFKGDYRYSFGRGLGRLLARLDLPPHVTAVVPVPSPPNRIRLRGYHPVAILAEPLARSLGVPLVEALECLDGQAAKALSEEERRAQKRFAPLRAVTGHVVLVDDVITTGTTVSECARCLKEAGADQVSVAALALTVRKNQPQTVAAMRRTSAGIFSSSPT